VSFLLWRQTRARQVACENTEDWGARRDLASDTDGDTKGGTRWSGLHTPGVHEQERALERKACMWHGDVRGVVCRRYRWKRSAAEIPQDGLGDAREKLCPQSGCYTRNCRAFGRMRRSAEPCVTFVSGLIPGVESLPEVVDGGQVEGYRSRSRLGASKVGLGLRTRASVCSQACWALLCLQTGTSHGSE
jgi:hypothetical protein